MTASVAAEESPDSVLVVRGVFRIPLRVHRPPARHGVTFAQYEFDGIATSGTIVTEAKFSREVATDRKEREGSAKFGAVASALLTASTTIFNADCAVASLREIVIDVPKVVFSSPGAVEWIVIIEGVGIAQLSGEV